MLKSVVYLLGDEETIRSMPEVPALLTFDDRIVDFFNDLSRAILSKHEYRRYVDLMSYGFWIRKSHLMKERIRYEGELRMGKGVTFHITPSNVPVNFAVSMTSALLAGNACIIRVSDKEFDQVSIITAEIREILHKKKYEELKKYICIIRYPHSKEITDYLSGICDIRIVWGGDRTIDEVRKSSLPPRGCEMTFADRHSLAVIDATFYASLSDAEAKRVARDFYTDTYYSDQNACSSPRLVVWYNGKSQERFWDMLKKKVKIDYEMQPVVVVDKLEKFVELVTDEELIGEIRKKMEDESAQSVQLVDRDPICMRIGVDGLSDRLMDYKMLGGYFFEFETNDLSTIVPVLGKQEQTVAYLGVDPEVIVGIVRRRGVRGVDRIVPMGHTMDLSFFWDGYDMVEAMGRRINTIRGQENRNM